jgi:hypothetical protein
MLRRLRRSVQSHEPSGDCGYPRNSRWHLEAGSIGPLYDAQPPCPFKKCAEADPRPDLPIPGFIPPLNSRSRFVDPMPWPESGISNRRVLALFISNSARTSCGAAQGLEARFHPFCTRTPAMSAKCRGSNLPCCVGLGLSQACQFVGFRWTANQRCPNLDLWCSRLLCGVYCSQTRCRTANLNHTLIFMPVL